MKFLPIVTSLLLLTVLTSKAQSPYTFLLKGHGSPYDSGVVIHLPTYRVETNKLRAGETLVDSLISEIKEIGREHDLLQENFNSQSFVIKTQERALIDKDKTISGLSLNYNALHAIATEPKKWYEKPTFWVGGFIVFELLQILISK